MKSITTRIIKRDTSLQNTYRSLWRNVFAYRSHGKSSGDQRVVASRARERDSAPDRRATRSHRRVPHCCIIALIFTFVSHAPLTFARCSLFRGPLKSPLYRRFQCTSLEKGARLFHFSLSLFFPAPANLPAFDNDSQNADIIGRTASWIPMYAVSSSNSLTRV